METVLFCDVARKAREGDRKGEGESTGKSEGEGQGAEENEQVGSHFGYWTVGINRYVRGRDDDDGRRCIQGWKRSAARDVIEYCRVGVCEALKCVAVDSEVTQNLKWDRTDHDLIR